MALIYGVAGMMCLFAAAWPISDTAPRTLATVTGVFLVVCSIALLRFGTSLPSSALKVGTTVGILVNSVLVASCTTRYGAALNCFAYLWIGIYAGQFFEQRAVRIQCGLIAAGSAVALAISGLPGLVTVWVLVAGSTVLAAETLARLNTRLRAQLITDPLTGLLNRAGFTAAAERMRALADRSDLRLGIALIDLDEFKQVNDRHGHAVGDQLLVDLGQAWQGELRESDALARLGGDEFALLSTGIGGDGTETALRRLRSASEAEWSAGVVEWHHGESLERAMARADEELYRSKRRAHRLLKGAPGQNPEATPVLRIRSTRDRS